MEKEDRKNLSLLFLCVNVLGVSSSWQRAKQLRWTTTKKPRKEINHYSSCFSSVGGNFSFAVVVVVVVLWPAIDVARFSAYFTELEAVVVMQMSGLVGELTSEIDEEIKAELKNRCNNASGD